MKHYRLTIAILLTLGASSAPAAAQGQGQEQTQDSRLQRALRLAQDGGSDSARAVVQGILAATPTGDSLYPEALYTAGLIAHTAQQAQRYFRRVVLEYGWSPWADDALLRLAQLRYAAHDALGTVRAADRLYADYPSSPLIPTAAYWAARASVDRNDDEAACRWVDRGLARTGENVETANQLRYFSSRCDSGRASGDSAGPAGQPAPPPARPPAGPVYRVQVAAVSSETAANGVAAEVRRQGFPAVVLAEGNLYKVRAGEYHDRAAADRAVRTIRSLIGGKPFVVVEE